MEDIGTLVQEWHTWAQTATSRPYDDWRAGWEDGWQTDFPKWDDLMNAAISVMKERPLAAESSLELVAFCWELSEEMEQLADWARDHIDEVWDALCWLAQSKPRDARWQVYSVMPAAGPRGESILRRALNDSDSYCRRRALLSLALLNPPDAEQLARRFLDDGDPYMRIAAVEMTKASRATGFINEVRERLAADEDPYVRAAAVQLSALQIDV